jgi:hypothetical protein
MSMTLLELRKSIQNRRETFPGMQKCVECKVPLQETITGNRRTEKGHVCSDCYFKLVGDELERNPIHIHKIVRGA